MRCNSLIASCRDEAKWQHALWVLRFVESQLEPNVVTLSTALDSCGMGSLWGSSLALLLQMNHANLEFNAITCNGLLKAAARASQWLQAVAMFQAFKMGEAEHGKPRLILYTSAINACAQSQATATALSLLSDFEASNSDLPPDVA